MEATAQSAAVVTYEDEELEVFDSAEAGSSSVSAKHVDQLSFPSPAKRSEKNVGAVSPHDALSGSADTLTLTTGSTVLADVTTTGGEESNNGSLEDEEAAAAAAFGFTSDDVAAIQAASGAAPAAAAESNEVVEAVEDNATSGSASVPRSIAAVPPPAAPVAPAPSTSALPSSASAPLRQAAAPADDDDDFNYDDDDNAAVASAPASAGAASASVVLERLRAAEADRRAATEAAERTAAANAAKEEQAALEAAARAAAAAAAEKTAAAVNKKAKGKKKGNKGGTSSGATASVNGDLSTGAGALAGAQNALASIRQQLQQQADAEEKQRVAELEQRVFSTSEVVASQANANNNNASTTGAGAGGKHLGALVEGDEEEEDEEEGSDDDEEEEEQAPKQKPSKPASAAAAALPSLPESTARSTASSVAMPMMSPMGQPPLPPFPSSTGDHDITSTSTGRTTTSDGSGIGLSISGRSCAIVDDITTGRTETDRGSARSEDIPAEPPSSRLVIDATRKAGPAVAAPLPSLPETRSVPRLNLTASAQNVLLASQAQQKQQQQVQQQKAQESNAASEEPPTSAPILSIRTASSTDTSVTSASSAIDATASISSGRLPSDGLQILSPGKLFTGVVDSVKGPLSPEPYHPTASSHNNNALPSQQALIEAARMRTVSSFTPATTANAGPAPPSPRRASINSGSAYASAAMGIPVIKEEDTGVKVTEESRAIARALSSTNLLVKSAAAAASAAAVDNSVSYPQLASHLLTPKRFFPHLKSVQSHSPDPDATCFSKLLGEKLLPALESEKSAVFALAKMPYDSSDPLQYACFTSIYEGLTGHPYGQALPADSKIPGSGTWTSIGFQREGDFSSDLRGAGMLGPLQALWLLHEYPSLASALYACSIHPVRNFPFMIQSISMTAKAMQALRMGKLDRLCNREHKGPGNHLPVSVTLVVPDVEGAPPQKPGPVFSAFNHFYAALMCDFYASYLHRAATINQIGTIVGETVSRCYRSPEKAVSRMHEALNRVGGIKQVDEYDRELMKEMSSSSGGASAPPAVAGASAGKEATAVRHDTRMIESFISPLFDGPAAAKGASATAGSAPTGTSRYAQ